MSMLPKRLQRAPLIDVIFELRFKATVPAMPISSILPGLFFAKIDGEKKIERLPFSEFPAQVRQSNLDMRYAPLARLHFDGYAIAVGDESVSLACKLPYRGWGNFKNQIVQAFEILMGSDVVGEIDRYSMRYVNVIEGAEEGIRSVNLDIKLGERRIEREPFQFRVDIARNDLQQVISIGWPAIAKLADGTNRQGVLVDIDVSCNTVSADFPEMLSEKLDEMHQVCKENFYEYVTGETIEMLGALYD